MKAVIVEPQGRTAAVYGDWPDPQARPGEVLVSIRAAALNRTDLNLIDRRHRLDSPCVIGADGAGIVIAAGDESSRHLVGAEVVILPSLGWGSDLHRPAEDLGILGGDRQGTHAELVTIPAGNVFARPPGLSWEQAAALPLAGLTAWRAVVTKACVRSGSRVLITGASGGVATFAVQIAASLGATVVVTTSTREGVEQSISLGASSGLLRAAGWSEQVVSEGPFDAVIDSSGAEWDALIASLKIGGRLVTLGRTAAPRADIDLYSLFWRQISIEGTSMGSPAEFAALLDHVARAELVPTIDRVVSLVDGPSAYDELRQSHFGKIVLVP